ncbi:hypothetical protein NHG30_12210 [Stenotrophomonas maltophilia]|nr:hypothetical protein [Stenotrophomonas maltophilia]MCO5737251.1 hypothetical protein [Stenotrophomonas maltophilia]
MFRQTVAVLAVLIAGALPIAAHAAPAQQPIFGAYYPGGSAERYPVSSIPAERLTHLFYAFSTIEDGRCTVGAKRRRISPHWPNSRRRTRTCAR